MSFLLCFSASLHVITATASDRPRVAYKGETGLGGCPRASRWLCGGEGVCLTPTAALSNCQLGALQIRSDVVPAALDWLTALSLNEPGFAECGVWAQTVVQSWAKQHVLLSTGAGRGLGPGVVMLPPLSVCHRSLVPSHFYSRAGGLGRWSFQTPPLPLIAGIGKRPNLPLPCPRPIRTCLANPGG